MGESEIGPADARRAIDRAVAGVGADLDGLGGTLIGTDSWEDDAGRWLRVRATVPSRPAVEVRCARILVRRDGRSHEPGLEAILFSSGFLEAVHTEVPYREAVDSVIDLYREAVDSVIDL